MWLLGKGMRAALEAQSRGVNPPAEEVLVDTVFGWIKRAWTGVDVPGGNPFVAGRQGNNKVVAVRALGCKKELSPTEKPPNLMLAQANLTGVSCPIVWIGSREVAGRWASMALAAGGDGIRRVLGLKEGSVREWDVAEGLLLDLASRGLDAGADRLIITEGSRTLDRALGQVWSGRVKVAHCLFRLHDDVVGHFPEAIQEQRSKELMYAWSLPLVEATTLLREFVGRWSSEAPGAVERLERSLDASLMVARLGVGSPLKERLESAGTLQMAFKKAVRWTVAGSGRPTLSVDPAWLRKTRRLAGWHGLDLLAHALRTLSKEPRNNPAPKA